MIVENITSQIVVNEEYVDTSQQIEKHATKYGNIVTFHLTFVAKVEIPSSKSIFSGLPKPLYGEQFTATNFTTQKPTVLHVSNTGSVSRWYTTVINAGDTVRAGYTYICNE